MSSFHRSTLTSIARTDRRLAVTALSEHPRFLFKPAQKARIQTKPSRPSQVRLVIHKRLERRLQHQHRLLMTSIACNVLLVILLVASIWGAINVSAFYQDTQSKLDALANPTSFPQTTRFYDRNGNLLWEMLGSENTADYRTYVPLGIIPPDVMNATVDTEDKTFWTNNGVDVTSILRAGLANITDHQISEGGSTITQQLMKDAFFVDPKTGVAAENLQRKIQEALMAYAVTQHYRKQDILEFYLNIIFYGYLSQGIEAAAENYFNKMPFTNPTTHQLIMGVQQLNLAQAAMLAGLPQGPSLYAPCGGDDGMQARRDAALKRMHDVVLPSMLNVGDITQAQFDAADAQAHKPDFFQCREEGAKIAPHVVDYVARQVLAPMLTDDGTVERGLEILAHTGWNIYTTIDKSLEQQVELTVNHYLFQPHTNQYDFEVPAGTVPPLSYRADLGGHNIHDAAVVVMNPTTGDILAMDGSGSYGKSHDSREGGQNNEAIIPIQPGASFAPIIYATAFEEGWFPALVVQNERVCFPFQVDPKTQAANARQACGTWFAPGNNFNLQSSGAPGQGLRLRDALGNSLNVPAVQALYFAGLDNVIIQAERMGLDPSTFSAAMRNPYIALGAASTSLLDLTDAYSVFANGGYHVAPRSILLITDAQGKVIPGADFSSARVQVLSPQTAFLITSILQDNDARAPEFGINNALTFGNGAVLYAAAKTRNTNLLNNVTIGYTPSLTTGVWVGNADGEPMTPDTVSITGAAPIWHDVTLEATQLFNYPNSYWPIPQGVGLYKVNGATGLAPYRGTHGSYSDWFNDAALPDVS